MIKLNVRFAVYRRNSILYQWPVMEVVGVSAITAAVSYLVSLIPHVNPPRQRIRRDSNPPQVVFLRCAQLPLGFINRSLTVAAVLSQSPIFRTRREFVRGVRTVETRLPRAVQVCASSSREFFYLFFSSPTAKWRNIFLLILTALTKVFFTAWSFGMMVGHFASPPLLLLIMALQIPAGIFLPTIAIGACLGRAMGLIM